MIPYGTEAERQELTALGVPVEALIQEPVTPASDPAMDLIEALDDTGHERILAALSGLTLEDEAEVQAGLYGEDRKKVKRGLGAQRWHASIESAIVEHAVGVADAAYQAVRCAYIPGEEHGRKPTPAGLTEWIAKNVAARAVGISGAGRAAIRAAVGKAIRAGKDTASVQAVKDAIGLTPKQLGTLDRYRDSLKAEEAYTAAEIRALVAKRRDEMLTDRAKLIARDETARAAAAAQKYAWKEMAKEGRLRKGEWVKLWETRPELSATGPCPVCEDLDGEEVPLDGLFDGEFDMPPDPHPFCKCRVLLVKKKKKR